MRILAGSSALTLWLVATQAWSMPFHARFSLDDATAIDEESRSSEIYSDIISYRRRGVLHDKWQESSTGYYGNAGSVDANRLFFDQEIKFAADPYGPVDLAVHYQTYQDTIEDRRLREIRLAKRLGSPLYLTLLGFSDTQKSIGDIGTAIEWRGDPQHHLSLHYVVIDYFYNDKTEDTSTRYHRQPWESGVQGRWQWGKARLSGAYTYTGSTDWRSEAVIYQQSRQQLDVRLDRPFTADSDVYLGLAGERKAEARQRRDETGRRQALSRRVGSADAGAFVRFAEGRRLNIGTLVLSRAADYTDSEPDAEDRLQDAKRGEALTYTYLDTPLTSDQRLGYGLIVAHVERRVAAARTVSTELKPQIAWETMISERGSLKVNSTFDLDAAVTEFPYRDGVPIWDGGNLQIALLF